MRPIATRSLHTAAALVAGLALRLGFIRHAARIAGDTLIYGEIAKNWMLHNVYGFAQVAGVPQPTLIRLPGYPLFLMACFRLFGINNYAAVLYLQAAIDLLVCLLLASFAGRLVDRHGSHRARTAALWLACLCPFTASYTAAPLTETLTLACIALGFFALERWHSAGRGFNRWLWTLAFTLAYAILLRPEQGLLAAAILPAMLWLSLRQATQHLRATLPVFTAALLTILPLVPWTLRNAHTFHVLQPLAPRYATDPGEFIPLGFQRWYRTWAVDFASTEEVYWNYDGTTIRIADLPTRAFDSADQYARTAALLNDYNPTTNATPELDLRFDALALERIAAHPLRYYVALPLARLVNMALRPRVEMLNTPLEWWKYRVYPGQAPFAAAYATLNAAYFALATWGVILWHRRGHTHMSIVLTMLAFILLRSALLLTIDNSEPRYTLEFFPILFLLAAMPFARATADRPSSSYPF